MTPPLAVSPGTLHVIYSWRGHDFYAITPHPHSPSSDSPSRTAAPTTAREQGIPMLSARDSSPESASSSVGEAS